MANDLSLGEQRTYLRTLYDTLRTSLLNRLYYEKRLGALQRWNTLIELLIALGASGTAIAAWAVWKTGAGKAAWAFIAGGAAVLSICKPIVALPSRVEKVTKAYTGFSGVFFDLDAIRREAEASKYFDSQMKTLLLQAVESYRRLQLEPDDNVKGSLALLCQSNVRTKYAPFKDWLGVSFPTLSEGVSNA